MNSRKASCGIGSSHSAKTTTNVPASMASATESAGSTGSSVSSAKKSRALSGPAESSETSADPNDETKLIWNNLLFEPS